MTRTNMKMKVVCRRKGVYEVGGVVFNATSKEEAIRKYTRGKKS